VRIHLGDINQAVCPSMEQLQGIVDPSDPCQNEILSLPLSSAPANTTIPSQATASSLAIASGVPTPPTTSSNTLLYIGLAAVGAMLLIGMGRK